MFGLDFLFVAGLFALPLAGAPLLLHLLFRRKSPTVQFSTLRFVRASIQQTAARRRLQRFLLLTCRILLLALLIWAVAQPVKRLAASWTAGAHSTIAAIVIDTSFSMQLKDGERSLLARADAAAQDLLRTELKDARVAIFTSRDGASENREQLAPAAGLLAQWTPLNPETSARTLGDRVAAARAMLARQVADQKWLVIVSDLQSREFPRPLESSPDVRTVLLDLHPALARSAGITNLAINPAQPIPGVASELAIDVGGRAGESRAVALRIVNPASPSGDRASVLLEPPPMTATLGASGRTTIRAPLKLPAEPWLLVDARFANEDAMGWDDARSVLAHLPARQAVRVLDLTSASQAGRFVRLALDPNEGRLAFWPLVVRAGGPLSGDDRVVVVLMSHWPEAKLADEIAAFAGSGRTVILMPQPGMETVWKDLSDADRAAWAKLLPALPAEATFTAPLHLVGSSAGQSLFGDLLADADLPAAQVRRMIRFDPTDRSVETMLTAASDSSRKLGLLFRRTLGGSQAFTLATLPDSRFTNLATHPIFLPMLVRLALQPPQQRDPLNAELGQPISISAEQIVTSLTIETPAGATFQVPATRDDPRRFIFTQADRPGLYTWHTGATTLGYTNVQPPASESELVYRPADSVIARGDNVLVVASLDEMRQKMQQLAEPQPRWSLPMALVLVLLCAEALIGTLSARA